MGYITAVVQYSILKGQHANTVIAFIIPTKIYRVPRNYFRPESIIYLFRLYNKKHITRRSGVGCISKAFSLNGGLAKF
jgi:hypothetical protein